MRADRLLSILLLLQVHRKMTASELAERLEVSKRTILRDIDALSAAGIPIFAERGKDGGLLLPDGYRTQLTGMGTNELQSLFLMNSTHVLKDLGMTQAAEGASLKLLASLPAHAKKDAEFMRERIHIDGAGWHKSNETVPYLSSIQEAIWAEKQVDIVYPKDGIDAERRVHPLGLVAKGTAWYLVAWTGGELRSFRVSRIRAVNVLDERAERPESFDLAAYWEQSPRQFMSSLPTFDVRLRAAPSILRRIRNDRFIRILSESASDADGSVQLDAQFHTIEHAAEFAMSGGMQVLVLEPEELRSRVIRTIAAMAAQYGES